MTAPGSISGLDCRLWRLSRELRQVDVAKAMGVSRVTVLRLEQRRSVRPKQALRYLQAVKVASGEA